MLTGIDCARVRAPPSSLEEALVARYAGFTGWLRANGFRVTSSDVAASIEVAQRVGQLDREVSRWSLRAVLCSRAEEWRRFDELFDAYFLAPNLRKLVQARAHSGVLGARRRAVSATDVAHLRAGCDLRFAPNQVD